MLIRHSRVLLALASVSLLLAVPNSGVAQARSFLYSVLPRADAARTVVYSDIGYGRQLFAAVGPEQLEHGAGAQLFVSPRVTMLAHVGWAVTDAAMRGRVSGGAEILATLSAPTAHTVLAIGFGGTRDYMRSMVVRGRLVAGRVGKRTSLVGNLNLERVVSAGPGDARDAIDVITTLGLSHQVTNGLRLGAESVAEDLEGFFEADEAEGGAKLMLGPTIGVGSRASRWTVTVAGGPVLRLTRSTVPGVGSGAERALGTTGYVVRTSISYEW